jgi:hypothetical protein
MLRKIERNEWMAIESWLVSRKLTEIAGPWNEEMTLDDDGEYFCRVISASSEIRFIEEAKSFVRRGNAKSLSYTSDFAEKKLKSQFHSLRSSIQSLRALETSSRTQSACLEVLQRWSSDFYNKTPEIYREMEGLAIRLGGRLATPKREIKIIVSSKLLGSRNALRVKRIICLARIILERGAEKFWFAIKNGVGL